MKFSVAALSATFLALASGAAAQLSILSPGGPNLWWIAGSDNDVTWTCHTSPYTNFTILIANSNPSVLAGALAFVAQQNNFDCSELITQQQINMTPATGYTIQLADPFNNTNIYAESQPFEIKALGAIYPASSATPAQPPGTATGATGSITGSATLTGSTATGSATAAAQQKNGAAGLSVSAGLTAAAFAALGLMFA